METKILQPTIEGLAKDGIFYSGFIFVGLIKVGDEPFVIEYNCRMGDPETEVVIPRLKNDLLELFKATAAGRLNEWKIETDDRTVCTIMAVSGGYPGDYQKGFPINGLNQDKNNTLVFHAGTKRKQDATVTAGGRVLCVSSFGSSVKEAVSLSKEVLEKIEFDGMYYRRDIGYEFI